MFISSILIASSRCKRWNKTYKRIYTWKAKKWRKNAWKNNDNRNAQPNHMPFSFTVLIPFHLFSLCFCSFHTLTHTHRFVYIYVHKKKNNSNSREKKWWNEGCTVPCIVHWFVHFNLQSIAMKKKKKLKNGLRHIFLIYCTFKKCYSIQIKFDQHMKDKLA